MTRLTTALSTATTVGLVLAAALAAASPANATSRGFRVYNLSSHPLRVAAAHATDVTCEAVRPGHCLSNDDLWEGRPKVGAVLMPGAEPHAWELEWGFLNHFHAGVTYDVVGTDAAYKAGLDTWTTSNDSTCSLPSNLGACTAEGLTLTISDPPGTVHDIPAARAQEQAETLRQLCAKSNAATCEFKPTKEEKATVPAHLVGDPVANCLEDEVEDRVTREDTVSESNSVDIKTGVETETNFIIEKAKVSVTAAYGHEWVTKHTFAQDLTLKVKPGDIAWVTSTAPVLRDTGDFVLKLGNTTWTLHDVFFDTPDPGRTARFVIDHRELTPQERTTMCTHVEPGDGALLSAPPGWVAMARIGSDGHDRMIGGPASNTLRGLSGSDLIRGEAGDDTLRGGRGADRIAGGRGSDRINGGPGDDVLHGGPGRDTLRGGPGADTIMDHAGATLVHTGTATGSGRDVVDVRDDRGDDTVICDSSHSLVIADAGDRVIGPCGQLIRGRH